MDSAAVLRRIAEIVAMAEAATLASPNGENSVMDDLIWCANGFRTALADNTTAHRDVQGMVRQKKILLDDAMEMVKRIDTLKSQLSTALADTRRVDWIADAACTVSDGYDATGDAASPFDSTHGRVKLLEYALPTVPRETPDWLRAAIDAAMAATPREEIP